MSSGKHCPHKGCCFPADSVDELAGHLWEEHGYVRMIEWEGIGMIAETYALEYWEGGA